MKNSIFFVDEEPYCIWEYSLKDRNVEFLNGIDEEYFHFICHSFQNVDDEKRASVATRANLFHAYETFFSLLGAYIQAPECAYAWMAKCSNKQLRDLVKKIGGNGKQIENKLSIKSVTWSEVSRSVFYLLENNSEKHNEISELFEALWQRLAIEFLEQRNIDEYNSIKHGLRVRSGGFTLAMGIKKEKGVEPPPEKISTVGHSKFGSTILKVLPVDGNRRNRSLVSNSQSLNWNDEKNQELLHLTALSIENVLYALKKRNGINPEQDGYKILEDSEGYSNPWTYSVGVDNLNVNVEIDPSRIKNLSKGDLIKRVDEIRGNKES